MTTDAKERFDRLAANFAQSEVHRASPSIERLHQIATFEEPPAVCDVACGAGHLGLSFAGRARRLVAVDPSPQMLSACQAQADVRGVTIETVEGYAESLPLPDAQFDLTISRLAAHHFREIEQAVREMARVTRPGGIVAVIDLEGDPDPAVDHFQHQMEMLHDPTHVRSYTAERWQALFAAAGLHVEAVERQWSERPEGLTVKRWCEIAASGADAEAQIRAMLTQAPASLLQALSIRRGEADFLLPIRTLLILGRRPD